MTASIGAARDTRSRPQAQPASAGRADRDRRSKRAPWRSTPTGARPSSREIRMENRGGHQSSAGEAVPFTARRRIACPGPEGQSPDGLAPVGEAGVFPRAAAHGDKLRELVRLCTVGDAHAVGRRIQEGQPIQASTHKRLKKPSVVSPLRMAIRKQRRNIVPLLPCNCRRPLRSAAFRSR